MGIKLHSWSGRLRELEVLTFTSFQGRTTNCRLVEGVWADLLEAIKMAQCQLNNDPRVDYCWVRPTDGIGKPPPVAIVTRESIHFSHIFKPEDFRE